MSCGRAVRRLRSGRRDRTGRGRPSRSPPRPSTGSGRSPAPSTRDGWRTTVWPRPCGRRIVERFGADGDRRPALVGGGGIGDVRLLQRRAARVGRGRDCPRGPGRPGGSGQLRVRRGAAGRTVAAQCPGADRGLGRHRGDEPRSARPSDCPSSIGRSGRAGLSRFRSSSSQSGSRSAFARAASAPAART